MKDELSRIEISRGIWSGFKVYIEYGVDVGSNTWKKGRKTHILGIFGGHVPVHVRNMCNTLCSISTSFRILAITYSFLIRFELFKWLIKLDFKENQTFRNRHRQILTLSDP